MTIIFGIGAALGMIGQVSPPLTLEDALKIAQQNAFSIKLGNSAIEKARQQANEARGTLGPKVTLDASYTRFDKAQTSNFNGTTITTRPVDSKDAKVTFALPFDIAGVTSKVVRSAFINVRIQELNRQAAENDLAQDVKHAFLQVLQAKAQQVVAQEAVDRAKERLTNVTAEYNNGARAKVDVLQIETTLRQAESDLITTQNSLQLAKNVLNNTLGRPIETPVDVADVPFWSPTNETEDELVKEATAKRPELQANVLRQDLLAFVRQSEERGNLPSLNLSVTHDRAFGQTGFGGSSGSTVGVLAMSWPLWDSGVTRARVKEARQDEEQAKIQGQQLALSISLEVRQARTNLVNAATRLEVARKSVELAQETYRLQSLRFSAGEGIPLEVAEASTELTRARTNLVSAQYDFLRAVADLERAVGGSLMEGKK